MEEKVQKDDNLMKKEEDTETEAPSDKEDKKTCKVCNKELDKVFRCSKCKKARYCGKDCQNQDWKSGHKLECFSEAIKREEPKINDRLKQFDIGEMIGQGNFSVK